MSDGDMFPPIQAADVRLEDILAELKRELDVRRSVYPGWVVQRRITAETAHNRITVLEAAIAYFASKGD